MGMISATSPTYGSNSDYLVRSIIIFLIWFAAVFDPIGNLYFLRYISLFSVIFCVFFTILISPVWRLSFNLRTVSVFYFVILTPYYGLLMFLLRGGWQGDFIDTSYLASAVLMVSTFIYINKRWVDVGLSTMILVLRLLVFVIIFVQISTIYMPSYSWYSFFTERGVALISMREYAGYKLPYVYFLASPLLIYIVGYDSWRLLKFPSIRMLVLCLFSVLALALSGTRAHILIALFSLPIFFIYTRGKHALATAIIFLILMATFLGLSSYEIISSFISPTETSNSMKIDMLEQYVNIFDNPDMLLFGQGFNAHVWSDEVQIMIADGDVLGASKTELTYFELIRVYGIIIGLPAFIIFGLVLRRIFSMPYEYRWLGLSFLLYLVNAALNPYIFSTNGILPFGLILALISYNKMIKVNDS